MAATAVAGPAAHKARVGRESRWTSAISQAGPVSPVPGVTHMTKIKARERHTPDSTAEAMPPVSCNIRTPFHCQRCSGGHSVHRMEPTPTPSRLTFTDITDALRTGRTVFRKIPAASGAYAAVFAGCGLVLLSAITALGFSPMVLPLAGGFMLVGPVLLTGFFELSRRHALGQKPTLVHAIGAIRRAPSGLWLVAALCSFLFLIWITDAGVLYSFTLGGKTETVGTNWLSALRHDAWNFHFWGSITGSVLAYMIFTISAFSVPLIYDERTTVTTAIYVSVRTVLGNFLVCIAWGILLGSVVICSILLLPLLLLTLPIMAYASYALYQRAFPATS